MNNNNDNFAEDKDKDYDCGNNNSESPNKYNNIDPLLFCLDVILKEAKEEDRLVKQIFYTMLSMYTNTPINLAINSPSGEGKTYHLRRGWRYMFPQQTRRLVLHFTGTCFN
jgi:hypothetical protein